MAEKELQRSYYAIIPANVRYDKDLTPNAKLLYGEITALCNEKGHCWATNDYFSNLYGVSKTSISKWINSLVKKGYVSSEIVYVEGTKQIDNRYLTIIQYPIKEKLNTPIEEKLNTIVKDTNTYTNNMNNTDMNNTFNKFIPPTVEEVQAYCNERKNGIDANEFIDFYISKGWMIGKNKMKDWKASVRTWERNNSKKAEKQETYVADYTEDFKGVF